MACGDRGCAALIGEAEIPVLVPVWRRERRRHVVPTAAIDSDITHEPISIGREMRRHLPTWEIISVGDNEHGRRHGRHRGGRLSRRSTKS